MTILQTKDGHVDITNDLLLWGTDEQEADRATDRFTDRLFKDQKRQGKVSNIIFGSEKLHVQLSTSNSEGYAQLQEHGGPNSLRQGTIVDSQTEPKSETYQFNINF